MDKRVKSKEARSGIVLASLLYAVWSADAGAGCSASVGKLTGHLEPVLAMIPHPPFGEEQESVNMSQFQFQWPFPNRVYLRVIHQWSQRPLTQ
ncbi:MULTISPECIES: hypothetical protein [Aeromonas]|uniref:hypothetical protein n=1 Tax=Aeromonas TaxID=642 RepID=UPI001115D849|nr:hypothetical protein [Aeromonas dhakensis]HCT2505077.1 hypothetical protein [Aeromonas dhakensis]